MGCLAHRALPATKRVFAKGREMRAGAAIKRDGEGRDFLEKKKGGAALGNHYPARQGIKSHTHTEGVLPFP